MPDQRDVLRPHLVPLVLGVTGHRALPADGSALAARLTSVFERIVGRFPDSPLVVLSALAEGTDRLAARLALDRFGATLVAPLPLSPDEYLADFASDASRDEFQSLLARAVRYFVVAGRGDAGPAPNERSNRYAGAGAFIVDHAHVLLGVWDRQPSRGRGGTAEVIEHWRSGVATSRAAPARQLLATAPRPYVILDPFGASEPTWHPGEPGHHGAWQLLTRQNQFNTDVISYSEAFGHSGFRSAAAAAVWTRPASGHQAGPDVHAVAARFASADALAVHLQSQERRVAALTYSVFGVALLLYGLVSWLPQLVAVHVFAIPAVWLLIRRARQRRLEDRALDYRALAEGLRVLMVWRLADLDDDVSAHYLNRHAGLVSWIRGAIAGVEALAARPTRPAPVAPDLDAIAQWMGGQRAYFRRAQQRLSLESARWAGLSRLAFALTLATAASYALFVWGPETWTAAWPAGHTIHQTLLGLWGSVGIVAEAYRRRRRYDDLIRQYAVGEQIFAAAERRLGDESWSIAGVLQALGREALAENGEWLWMRQAQTFESFPR